MGEDSFLVNRIRSPFSHWQRRQHVVCCSNCSLIPYSVRSRIAVYCYLKFFFFFRNHFYVIVFCLQGLFIFVIWSYNYFFYEWIFCVFCLSGVPGYWIDVFTASIILVCQPLYELALVIFKELLLNDTLLWQWMFFLSFRSARKY